MKLQKVLIVLGISVCLIATEMQATFGIGEEAGPEEALTEEELKEPGTVGTVQEDGQIYAQDPSQSEEIAAGDPSQAVQPEEAEMPAPVEGVSQTEGTEADGPSQSEEPGTGADDSSQSGEPGTADDPSQSGEPGESSDPAQPGQVPEAGETGNAGSEAPGTGDIFILDDNVDGTASGGEENSADGGASKEDDNTGNDEGLKAEDGIAGDEASKDEDGTGGAGIPKEEDGTGEDSADVEVPKEDDGTGEDSVDVENPKDDGSTGEDDADVENPKEEDGSGEDNADGEAPKEEDGTGEDNADGEVPKEDNSSDGNIVIDNTKTENDRTNDTADSERPKAENARKRIKNTQAEGKTSKQSSHMFSSFTPSSEFIDDREKVKYNVDVPVDGLPGFITQEMLVGALKCQDETGYPASVTIAQIIQESGFGKYGPDGDKGQGLSYLAYQYNNLFGIKGSGTAGSVAMNTGEQRLDGSRYNITAGFRVYNTYTECIEDRKELLERVYKDLTFGVKDANTFAMKIGSRWATSLSYGQNLIHQMDRYDLYRLDAMTLDEFSGMIGTFANPCPGARLTSDFGYREAPLAGASTYHKGIDLGTGAYNIPTYAAEAGTVTCAGYSGAAGNLVTIDHGNGLVTKYMHHDKIYVKQGDRVEKGQQIGLSGTTGNSTGNHLHFQVEKDGTAINPLLYLDIQK